MLVPNIPHLTHIPLHHSRRSRVSSVTHIHCATVVLYLPPRLTYCCTTTPLSYLRDSAITSSIHPSHLPLLLHTLLPNLVKHARQGCQSQRIIVRLSSIPFSVTDSDYIYHRNHAKVRQATAEHPIQLQPSRYRILGEGRFYYRQ